MSAVTIDKGIAPPAAPKRGRKALYPWAEMEVGDSFEVAGDYAKLRSISSLAARLRSDGRRFVCRQTSPSSIRVWRTA